MDSHAVTEIKLSNDGDGSHSVEVVFKDGSTIGDNIDVGYDAHWTIQKFKDGQSMGSPYDVDEEGKEIDE